MYSGRHYARRLNIHYIDENGAPKHPVIIHSAIPGGIERYLYSMFDNNKQGLPLWIQPVQIRLLPVSSEFVAQCELLVRQCAELPLRIEIDDRDVSISAKVKLAHNDLVPQSLLAQKKLRTITSTSTGRLSNSHAK